MACDREHDRQRQRPHLLRFRAGIARQISLITTQQPSETESRTLKKSHAPNATKVLLTGASGFIGRHCLQLLQEKRYEVHAVSSKPIPPKDSANLIWHQ